MKTISIANLKGGVGKTVTAINLAYLLVAQRAKKVLLIDNDQQGNTSQFFGVYDETYEKPAMSDILELRLRASDVIVPTGVMNLDIIPSNLSLAVTEKTVISDVEEVQQNRLQKSLQEVAEKYDYAIIDNGPSVGICAINAWVASDYVVIPAKIDRFTFDGINLVRERIEKVAKNFNPALKVLGILFTNYRHDDVNKQGLAWGRNASVYPTFKTVIRWSRKVDESTFARYPLADYSPRSGAAIDYRAWVNELLEMLEGRN